MSENKSRIEAHHDNASNDLHNEMVKALRDKGYTVHELRGQSAVDTDRPSMVGSKITGADRPVDKDREINKAPVPTPSGQGTHPGAPTPPHKP